MAKDDKLARELVEAGARSDDRGWQLPLTEDYAEQLDREHVPALPEGERLSWSLRASRLGTEVALADLVRITEGHGDRTGALAWAGYWRWSSTQGCDMSSYLMGYRSPAAECTRAATRTT